jgi:hypothetical protein
VPIDFAYMGPGGTLISVKANSPEELPPEYLALLPELVKTQLVTHYFGASKAIINFDSVIGFLVTDAAAKTAYRTVKMTPPSGDFARRMEERRLKKLAESEQEAMQHCRALGTVAQTASVDKFFELVKALSQLAHDNYPEHIRFVFSGQCLIGELVDPIQCVDISVTCGGTPLVDLSFVYHEHTNDWGKPSRNPNPFHFKSAHGSVKRDPSIRMCTSTQMKDPGVAKLLALSRASLARTPRIWFEPRPGETPTPGTGAGGPPATGMRAPGGVASGLGLTGALATPGTAYTGPGGAPARRPRPDEEQKAPAKRSA